MSFENFDIIEFLQDYDIPFRESGKNISRNYVGINCPYCGGQGEHFGINRKSKVGSCFQCGEKRSIYSLIKDIITPKKSEIFKILKKYSGNILIFEDTKRAEEIILPTGLVKLNKIGYSYLKSRGFNPEELERKYKIKSTSIHSVIINGNDKISYRNRIFIPFIVNHTIVGYTGRAINDQIDPKYKHSPVEVSIIPPASCLYNFDSIQEGGKALFVEGVTDTWKLGSNTAGVQGVTFTKEQVNLVYRKNLKKAVILFDENAEDKARSFANALNLKIPDVSYTTLVSGDPGDLSYQEAQEVKWELLGV